MRMLLWPQLLQLGNNHHLKEMMLVSICFNSGKPIHMAKKCISRLEPVVAPNAQVNLTNGKFIPIIIEINMVDKSDAWWIDTGVSYRVCYDPVMFKTYTNTKDKKVLLEDVHTTNVAEIGDMKLSFTSRKTLISKDVMHVHDIRKNCVSSFLLRQSLVSILW